VAVVGRLDNRGRIVFPDRAFAPGEVKRLAEWLDELKSYGAQGSPEGQRVWGLAKDQFGSVFESLMPRVEFETMDAPLGEILDHFKFSPKHPLKFTVGANNRLGETGRSEICTQSLRGIAQGTALSLILAERGLGMKPRRNPDGSIDLAIYDLQEAKNVWPVGWYQGNTPGKTAPSLFVFKEIHFDDVDVDSVLSASAEVTGVPVLIDRTNLKSKEIEFADIPVDFPLKKTTWAQAYDRILGKAGCKYELLNDESGRPFVWVTTLQTPSRKPQ
ncbi:MAG: hypothetical protein NT069_00505, partial [Planctomycetota bacterium]|nr:hypothetical protein [Planctomycetota bacterium]